jgi:hypothetical protein
MLMARVMSLVVEILRTECAFWAMWIIVGAISCYDAWLVQRYQFSILVLEENPLGRWLLEAGSGEVVLFVRAKLAGTLIVLSVLAALYRYCRRLAQPTAVALAAFQLGLLIYLTVDIPRFDAESRLSRSLVRAHQQQMSNRNGRLIVEREPGAQWTSQHVHETTRPQISD